MLTLIAVLMGAAGMLLAGLAAYVARQRGTRTGWSLAVLLVSVAWWGTAYAIELSVDEVPDKELWGGLKYVGICLLPPAWLAFVLQYVGRGELVTRRLLAALAIEPVLVLVLLAVPATHDLIRHYPPPTADERLPIVGTGPVFWVNLVYSNTILLGATALYVARMRRLARLYWRMAAILVLAALLPWTANFLHNFEVGWFARVDLTPFTFIVTGGVLVWGLFRERLVDLTPVARSAVVENMSDAVLVVDAFGRVVDVNPVAAGLLRSSRADLVGQPLEELVPDVPASVLTRSEPVRYELTLSDEHAVSEDGQRRTFDVLHQPLADTSGRPGGHLFVLREITERVADRERLERLLTEQTRVAAALQASMMPESLPQVPGCELASQWRPAGDGSEVGGDFFDVFPLDPQTWAFVLGDVSGSGAEAAAVSAAVRYTLRALADPSQAPSETLRQINPRLLAATEDERHCTLVYGHARPTAHGIAVTLSLAGHHQPLVLRSSGAVEPVGRLGMPLALIDAPELHDTTTLLAAGEVLCMFTDGLVESRRDVEMYGAERVADFLAEHAGQTARDLSTGLVESVRSFHGGDLADDLALLLLAHTGPAPLGTPVDAGAIASR